MQNFKFYIFFFILSMLMHIHYKNGDTRIVRKDRECLETVSSSTIYDALTALVWGSPDRR